MQQNIVLSKQYCQIKAYKTLAHKYLSDQVWRYSNSLYRDEKIQEILKLVQKANVKNIWFRNNNSPSILKNIVHINFDKLKVLDLNGNNIESLQIFYLIKMPQLQFLDLCRTLSNLANNKIANLNGFRKVHLSKLQYLSFSFNYIQNFDILSQLYTNNIDHLWLQAQKCGKVIKKTSSIRSQSILKPILKPENRNKISKYKQKGQYFKSSAYYVEAKPIIPIQSIFLDDIVNKNGTDQERVKQCGNICNEFDQSNVLLLDDEFTIRSKITQLLRMSLEKIYTIGLYGQGNVHKFKSKKKSKSVQCVILKKCKQLNIK